MFSFLYYGLQTKISVIFYFSALSVNIIRLGLSLVDLVNNLERTKL